MNAHSEPAELGADLLLGAATIGRWCFGSHPRATQRVYRHMQGLVSEERRLPLFKIGDQIAARKSTITRKIAELEAAGPA